MTRDFVSIFDKYVACGNDFLIFDYRNKKIPSDVPEIIKSLCHRQTGVGADGVLFLQNSTQADAQMTIVNADGTEAEMCGNGLCCLAHFLHTLEDKALPQYRIETKSGIFSAIVDQSMTSIKMQIPAADLIEEPLIVEEKVFLGQFLKVGVPHFITFVKDVEEIDVSYWGKLIRQDARWGKAGTNVNFVEVTSEAELKIRTFERGVEAETLGCGTGSVASALVFSMQRNSYRPLSIETKSKKKISVDCERAHLNCWNIGFSTEVIPLFRGELLSLSKIF